MNSFSGLIDNFEKKLIAFLQKYKDNPFYDCILYAVEGSGKRVRPLLVFLVAEALEKDIIKVEPIAIAIELIHSYSLVHDDLPSMDDDDMRRGKPSVHKKYGEGLAVLVGDALLNLAYEALLSNCNLNEGYIKGAAYLAEYAGIKGMVGGQYIDIGKKIYSEEAYIELYAKKTSALLMGACVASAYSLKATDKEIAALSDYALNLGIAFQLKDDLIEYEEKGSCHESNILAVAGVEKTKELCKLYTKKSIDSLNSIKNNQNLVKIANILLSREH